MFQRTEWWWYNIFQSGDTRCKVTFLHLCLALYFPSLSFSHPEIHLHPLTLRYINISQNMRMCVVFLPDCPCCEPLTVKGWITTILFFFFYPTSQWIRGHLSLKSFLLLTCHLLPPSSLYPWGPFFIFSSLFFCNIMCSLFLCSSFLYFLRGFHVFFNILSVFAVLQYSLCSPHASPPPCWGLAQFL